MSYILNKVIQNLGYTPNKEMSNKEWTAYNIDEKGRETVLDTLYIHNTKDIWFNKITENSGKEHDLIIKLNRAYDYKTAKEYLRTFVCITEPWQSDDDQKPLTNERMLNYVSDTREHIFKLQTFALMVRNFFDAHSVGYFHIKDFRFNDFIDTPEFREYYHKELKHEMDMIQDNPDEAEGIRKHYIYAHNAKMAKYPQLPNNRKRKIVTPSISQMLEDEERKYQEMLFTIEENGGDVEEFKKKYYEQIKKQLGL